MSLIIFLSVVSAFFLIIAAEFYNIIFRGYAPFISTKPRIIGRIMSELTLPAGAVVYELGCGSAPLLRSLSIGYPGATLIGIENELIPYTIAQIQVSLAKSNIKIRRKNMFKINLGDADVVYCYLNPKMMAKLEEKFLTECKDGARIISYQFALPGIKPEKTIEVDGSADKVFFYRIKKDSASPESEI